MRNTSYTAKHHSYSELNSVKIKGSININIYCNVEPSTIYGRSLPCCSNNLAHRNFHA